jgi:hypothetical protein
MDAGEKYLLAACFSLLATEDEVAGPIIAQDEV